MRPLEGVRVLAVEHYGAGPFGSMHLADMGADVIKIENPASGGDTARIVGPHLLGEGDSEFFQTLNRNKRSLGLNLKAPEGREVFEKLVATADGVTNNLRGDQPEKLRLTYDDLKGANPRIVCAHLSAYGRDGPRVTWPGYDYLMQGEVGFMALTGEPDGPPTRMGLSIVDWMTGVTGMLGLLSGVLAARETGKGRDIDVSLFDTALFQMSYPAVWYMNEGDVTPRIPRSGHPSLAPAQLYTAKDGYIYVMGLTAKFWSLIVEKIGRPDIGENPDFADFPARRKNRDKLTKVLDAVFAQKTVDEWMEMFAGIVPIGPVYPLDKALDSPYVAERGLIQTMDHPKKPLRVLSNPIRDNGEVLPVKPAPQLGQDTDDILGELGYSESDISGLREKSVV
ncbi:MAG: CoA transferase [Proteobacteria bacterium]|nr:CoA transferase [Pseudomonadota bacterium]